MGWPAKHHDHDNHPQTWLEGHLSQYLIGWEEQLGDGLGGWVEWVGWLGGGLSGGLGSWVVGWLINQTVDWSVSWSVGWLFGQSVGQLANRLTIWSVS